MSIIFKSISWRNFLSTGNSPTTIFLNKNKTTLITGTNGSGKSTMLDAICFVLFGKPFRNINKPQLCNSINGKNLLTEIEFAINGSDYKIVRGMKPNVFEIWQNGTLLNQDAASKDYQKVLEQQILRLNYKTFTQVAILGSASYVPFMQLPSGQRREVIEDILDIRIFSIMNQILRERSQQTKDEVQRIEDAVILAKEKVSAQKKLIQTIADAKESTVEMLETKINEALFQIETIEIQRGTLSSDVQTLTEAAAEEKTIKSDLKKITQTKNKLEVRLDSIQEQIAFMSEREDCPSCQQKIPHEHKNATIASAKTEIEKYESEKNTLEKCLTKLNKKLEKLAKLNDELTQKNIELSTCNNTITILNKQISSLNKEIQEHKKDTANIDAEKEKLKTLANDAMVMLDAKARLGEQKNLQEIAALLLKDTGIKTAIIREYLPVMNKLINKYLSIMDSYIMFELDESFNEVIKSRFRDDFTYFNFSEGEKQKIDLALIFAWRQIAKMKNSANTNLLIMDEVFDAALDSNATELLSNLLDQFHDSNIFVISHREGMADKFHSSIRFEKKNDYSVMV